MSNWFSPGAIALGVGLCATPALAGPYCSTIGARVCGDCQVNVSFTVVNAKVPRPTQMNGLARGPWCPFAWGNAMTRVAFHFDVVEPPRHGRVRTNGNTVLFASGVNGSDSFVMKQTWMDKFNEPRSATVTYNVMVVPAPM